MYQIEVNFVLENVFKIKKFYLMPLKKDINLPVIEIKLHINNKSKRIITNLIILFFKKKMLKKIL